MLSYSIFNELVYPHTYSGKIFNDQPPEPQGGFFYKHSITSIFTGIGVGVYFLLLAHCFGNQEQEQETNFIFSSYLLKKPLFQAALKNIKLYFNRLEVYKLMFF
jgi:hypothetical protein